MKNFLTGSAVMALALAATPAFAQSYKAANNVKSHDSTLSAATYAQPQTQVPAQTTPMPPPAPPVAQAEPAPAPEPEDKTADFSGPYIGGEAVFDDNSAQGWGGGAFAGFGWNPDVSWLKHTYLGAEAGFDWSSASDNFYAEHKKFNASLRPGVVFGPVLAYGILGYSRSDFKNNDTNQNNWLNGWVGGGGVEAALPHTPFKLRGEYDYTLYDKSDTADIGKPHDSEVKMGLVYQIPVKKGSMW